MRRGGLEIQPGQKSRLSQPVLVRTRFRATKPNGRGGIRTPETGFARLAVFKTAAFNRSATLPPRPYEGYRSEAADSDVCRIDGHSDDPAVRCSSSSSGSFIGDGTVPAPGVAARRSLPSTCCPKQPRLG